MPNISQSILRRLRDMYDNPKDYLQMVVDQLDNETRGREAIINREGAGYRKLSPDERRKRMIEGSLDTTAGPLGGGLGIIRNRGGNWLTGSVENALGGLKRGIHSFSDPITPEMVADLERTISQSTLSPRLVEQGRQELAGLQNKLALNKWIEGPLTKYVKRDMATPDDPVRALAEQGVLHYQPPAGRVIRENANFTRNQADRFVRTPGLDTPGQRVGISDLAKNWEDVSDESLNVMDPAFIREVRRVSPIDETWLAKLDQNTPVYEAKRGAGGFRDLGFSHLIDELQNALNPESGLPRHLLLTPEKMQQMGMEKAVRHVDAINKWRAEEMVKANLAKSQSPAAHLFKEYADNNPKGLRWVELKAPDQFDLPKWEPADQSFTQRFVRVGEDLYPVKYEAGKNPDHESVVRDIHRRKLLGEQLKYEGDTMGHCVGGYCNDVLSGRSRIFSLRDAKGQPHVTIEAAPGKEAERIIQIKGKQNRAPKEDYLPFVQDFVKSGKWSDVGDLENTGLLRVETTEGVQFLTPEEFEAAKNSVPKPGYAEGGLVQKPGAWHPIKLNDTMAFIVE